MTSCAMSAMGCSAVENTLLSSAATSIAFSTTVSTAGRLSIPCQPSSATDLWSKKAGIVHALQPRVKAGSSFNSKLLPKSLISYKTVVVTGNYHHFFLYLLVTFCNLSF